MTYRGGRRIVCTVTALAVFASMPVVVAPSANAVVDGKIVPGGVYDDAPPSVNPYAFVGRFITSSGGGCTAALVAPEFAVTIGHCGSGGTIEFGLLNKDRDNGEKRRVVSQIKFGDLTDVSPPVLVKLDKPIFAIKPVRLAWDKKLFPKKTNVQIVGWGQLSDTLRGDGTWSTELRRADLRIAELQQKYTLRMNSVTGSPTHGDSGAPVLIDHNNELLLIGTHNGSVPGQYLAKSLLWKSALRETIQENLDKWGTTTGTPGPTYRNQIRPGTVYDWGTFPIVKGKGDILTPVGIRVKPTTTGVRNTVALATGNGTFFALNDHGTVYSWGTGFDGALGYAKLQNFTPRPLPIPQVTAVAAAGNSAYAVSADGKVWAWGANNQGQLGNATTISHQPSPLSGMPTIVDVAAGYNTAYALSADGHVWAWGDNSSGQLGNGRNRISSTKPRLVAGLDQVIAISATLGAAFALRSDGTVWAWGARSQLGDPKRKNGSVQPIRVPNLRGITKIATYPSGSGALALRDDGTVFAWQVPCGDGTTIEKSVPTPVSRLSSAVTIGVAQFTCFATTADGRSWAWGTNVNGETGVGVDGSFQRLAVTQMATNGFGAFSDSSGVR